ncbi:MAG: hypothetical protein FWE21_06720 [Defluviitaleaceae bacterium]|nr:hypothetical protein [Defluviitaleaceae bacterium]
MKKILSGILVAVVAIATVSLIVIANSDSRYESLNRMAYASNIPSDSFAFYRYMLLPDQATPVPVWYVMPDNSIFYDDSFNGPSDPRIEAYLRQVGNITCIDKEAEAILRFAKANIVPSDRVSDRWHHQLDSRDCSTFSDDLFLEIVSWSTAKSEAGYPAESHINYSPHLIRQPSIIEDGVYHIFRFYSR